MSDRARQFGYLSEHVVKGVEVAMVKVETVVCSFVVETVVYSLVVDPSHITSSSPMLAIANLFSLKVLRIIHAILNISGGTNSPSIVVLTGPCRISLVVDIW